MALVEDLSSPGTVELMNTLEVPGRALGVGPDGAGAVLVASDESPTLTRYEISEDGDFDKGDTLSFASVGVTSLLVFAQHFVFVSERKAYYLDSSQIVIFDPVEMAIEGTVPLDDVVRDDWEVSYGMSAVMRGTELVFVASYFRRAEFIFDRETRLVVVDTTTDTVTSVETEERCGYLLHSAPQENGDIYFSSNILTSAVEEVLGSDFGGPSCMLLVKDGETTFDADFILDFEAVTGSTVAGSLLPGADGRLYTRLLDEDLLPEDASFGLPTELLYGEYFRWGELDLSDGGSVEVLDVGVGNGQSAQYNVGGRWFAGMSSADFASTTLLDFSQPTPAAGLTFTGIPFSIVRVR